MKLSCIDRFVLNAGVQVFFCQGCLLLGTCAIQLPVLLSKQRPMLPIYGIMVWIYIVIITYQDSVIFGLMCGLTNCSRELKCKQW